MCLYQDIETIEFNYTCIGISEREWNKLMENAVKANGVKIRALIKKHLPKLYYDLELEFYNPYEHNCKRTKTHLIYVHSAIEYFLKFN